MGGPTTAASTALQAQFNSLQETMQEGFRDIKEILQGIEVRVRAIENNEARCQPLVNKRLEIVEEKVREHSDALKALSDVVKELASTNKILKWCLGIATAVLTAFLIAVATGKVTLIVR